MRKLVLVVGSLAAVVLLALLVHVADQGDRVTYTGSSEQLKGRPGQGHRHHLRGHGHMSGQGHMKGHLKGHLPGPMPGPTFREVTCHLEDDALVLDYSYGASERVAPFVDARGRGLVVGVEVEGPPPGTIVPSIALLGEARFARFGEPSWIRNPDGSELPCPARGR